MENCRHDRYCKWVYSFIKFDSEALDADEKNA